MTELEPISAEEAVELSLQSAEGEKAASTVQSHGYRLQHFVRWCEKEGRENLNELSGRDLQAHLRIEQISQGIYYRGRVLESMGYCCV